MDKTLEMEYHRHLWQDWDPKAGLSRELPGVAAAELRERFDWEKGGFQGLSGEQEAGTVLFLLEYARRGADGWARGMAEAALERRGRTDSALLAYANLEAYAQTGRPVYRETACGMLDGAMKELRLAGSQRRRLLDIGLERPDGCRALQGVPGAGGRDLPAGGPGGAAVSEDPADPVQWTAVAPLAEPHAHGGGAAGGLRLPVLGAGGAV